MEQLEEESTVVAKKQSSQGPTLLWGPAAKIVSGLTGVGSFYVHAGSKIGGWGVTVGREATLKTLEVSRSVAEYILHTAGRDVSSRRSTDLGRAEADNILERSISSLHSTIASISFVASTGFYITQASIDTLSALSLQGLSTLNAVLGSTESSRAVAAIITLMKDELNKPGAQENGEGVSYLDMLVAIIGFVLLQRWGRRKTEMQFRDDGGEETIWDIVVDDRGFRADVVGTKREHMVTASKSITRAVSDGEVDEDTAMVLERGLGLDHQPVSLSAREQTNLSDEQIRDLIIQQLPPGTRARVTTDTMSLKKITVEILEGETAHIEPPPGMTMVSESLGQYSSADNANVPQQTVVFRTSLTRSNSAEIEPIDRLKLISSKDMEVDGGDADDLIMMRSTPDKWPPITLDTSFLPTSRSAEVNKPLPLPPSNTGPVANQKRSRRPGLNANFTSDSLADLPVPQTKRGRGSATPEKKGSLKQALQALSPTQTFKSAKSSQLFGTGQSTFFSGRPSSPTSSRAGSSPTLAMRIYPPQPMTEAMAVVSPGEFPIRRDTSAYFTMHEKKRESTVTQTDTYSIHSAESRSSSPSMIRTHARTSSGMSKIKSQTELAMQPTDRPGSRDGERHHRRSHSFVPSLYSMGTKHSDEAIILAPKTRVTRSIFEDHKMLVALTTDGKVPGMFPSNHLVKTIRRFARFASASYGSNFLRVMGISSAETSVVKSTDLTAVDLHHEHSSFSTHTGLPADSILLSSFVDPNGATMNADSYSSVMSPLVHFVSIDHDSKAVVLTCRGTLGFEDVLADMTCDYDDIRWQGATYKVHRGIHASARRLLGGVGGRVMSTIKTALEEHPDYGLVLCGHSLGGAVAAIVAVLIAAPSKSSDSATAFVTAPMQALLTENPVTPSTAPVTIPAGRPIHAYAYGSPAVFSEPLRLATRALITTIINSSDVVPQLSLGTLHDFRSVAFHLKKDTTNTMSTLKDRVVSRIKDGLVAMIWTGEEKGPPHPENMAGDGVGEDNWAWTALCTLRKQLTNEKLVPPGECFIVEMTRVFDRHDSQDATSGGGADEAPEAKYFRALGRPATRVQFKLIRDVERRFSEIRFGRECLSSHSPKNYERSLNALQQGICED